MLFYITQLLAAISIQQTGHRKYTLRIKEYEQFGEVLEVKTSSY